MKSLPWFLMAMAGATALAADWSQWRGPEFNGSSTSGQLPVTWSPSNNIAWKTALPGQAGSTPVLRGNRLFLTSPDAGKNLLVLGLDAGTGKILWQKQVGTNNREKGRNNMSSPSPVADASRVYALFATGDLAAFDHDGKPVWSRNLAADYGAFAVMWIYGASPLLLGDRLIIPVLQRTPVPRDYSFAQDGKAERESYLLCLDAATGTNVWKQVRKSDAVEETQEAYTTPIPWQRGGKTEILLFGANHLTAHDPASGAELWRSVDLNPSHERWWRVVPSPVAASDLVIVCNPKRAPVHALRPGADRSAAIAWSFSDFPSDCVTPLLYRGRLYVLDGDRQMMTCLDPASGRKLWEGSLGVRDIFRASPTGADGRVYCLSEKGNTVVLEAGDEFKVLATNWLGDEPVRSSIPVADGRLYVRTASALWCVQAGRR